VADNRRYVTDNVGTLDGLRFGTRRRKSRKIDLLTLLSTASLLGRVCQITNKIGDLAAEFYRQFFIGDGLILDSVVKIGGGLRTLTTAKAATQSRNLVQMHEVRLARVFSDLRAVRTFGKFPRPINDIHFWLSKEVDEIILVDLHGVVEPNASLSAMAQTLARRACAAPVSFLRISPLQYFERNYSYQSQNNEPNCDARPLVHVGIYCVFDQAET
jgi:hypothetical protein